MIIRGRLCREVKAITPVQTVPIYATLAWGFSPETWSAVGFSLESVRNALARDLRDGGGLVLTIGTMGVETAPRDQGRLLGLHHLATLPIRTEELVEPSVWQAHLNDNDGKPKWPFGLPMVWAERFDSPPLRKDILPRLHAENLHRKLASNYEPLAKEEAAAVLSLSRTRIGEIWSTPTTTFATRRIGRRPTGPKPNPGERTLSVRSGPAATYCFILAGSGLPTIAANVAPAGSNLVVYKVGFSNDPERRRSELNAYLPDARTLEWRPCFEEWHEDEINAWAMEQQVFRLLRSRGGRHVKGEIVASSSNDMLSAWTSAVTSTTRPQESIVVTIGSEESLITE